MANNCDDIFQQIQALEQQRQALLEADQVLHSAEPPQGGDGPPQGPREMDPARRWLISDKATGKTYEANMASLDEIRRALSDGDFADLVTGRIDARERPLGRDGQFTNFAQMVDRMTIDDAKAAGELIEAMTGRWSEQVPADFERATRINDKAALMQRVADSYAEAGIRVDLDTLSQGIAKDAAPFMTILDKQANLQVFNAVAKDNLITSMRALSDAIESTGLPPSAELLDQFRDAAVKAVFAERSAAISRRVSGQLLQQLKGDFSAAPGLAGKAFKEQLQREAEELFNGNGPLLTEGTLAGQVEQAAALGVDGVKDLQDLTNTVKAEGLDPTRSLEEGWKDNWRRQARAFGKDSLLFNMNTQAVSNYLSNKVAYWMEGYRAGWNNTFSLPNTGTPFLLDVLQKPMQGHRIALTAKLLTDDVVRQAVRDALGDGMPEGLLSNARGSWKQVFEKGVMEGRNPFNDPERGVEIDVSGRSTSLEQEWTLANKILFGEDDNGVANAAPDGLGGKVKAIGENIVNEIKINPAELPFVLRDRVHLSTKIVMNHLIEGAIKTTTGNEVRLPLTGALQTLAAVDSRAGLRVYTAVRANDLLMQTFKTEPDISKMSWDQRKAEVKKQLDDELYKATPSKAQIDSYRKQFGLPEEVTDEKISADIAAKHVGAPVLDTPDRAYAFHMSKYARMQLPPTMPLLKDFDEWVQKSRDNSYVDAFIPYWRAGSSGMLYVMENMTPPVIGTAKMVFGKVDATTKAKTMASWMVFTTWWGMFMGLRNGLKALESSAPGSSKDEREQWKLRNQSNTFFGIPGLGQVPLVSVFLMMNDIADAAEAGALSRFDQKDMFIGAWQVFSGQLFRATGFGQFRAINDALMSENPKQFLRAVGYLANGQYNPASGVMRQIERIGGLGSDARYEPRFDTPADRRINENLKDLPGAGVWEKIREKLFYLQPMLSNLPLKETDYLGRELRTPEGWFKREWPTGWPGVYDASVHNQLLEIGMLKPPTPLVTGRLGGVALGADGEKEFNKHLNGIIGERPSDHPGFASRLVWNGRTVVVEEGEERTATRPVHLGDFIDSLTEGRDLHGALNKLFQSPTWKRWQQDPELTLTPSKLNNKALRAGADRTRAELLMRPGAKVVQLLHAYYGLRAEEEFMNSPSPTAQEWRERYNTRLTQLGTEDQLDQKVEGIESSLEMAY